MNTNTSDNNTNIRSQTQTQTQAQDQATITNQPWQSPLEKSTLSSASSATVVLVQTTNAGSPVLTPPDSPTTTPTSRITNADGSLSLGAGSNTINILRLNYTSDQITDHLQQVVAHNPDAVIQGTQIPVKNLLTPGTQENDIHNYLNAPANLNDDPAGPPIPVTQRQLNPFSPPITTGSQHHDSFISPQYNIRVQSLHTPGSLANTIYMYLMTVSQLIANAPPPAIQLNPLPSFAHTAATEPQINATMSKVISTLPAGDTKTIFQFLHDNGGEEGIANMPHDTPIPGTNVTVGDLRRTGSPAHDIVVEHSAMRAILGILIQLKTMLNQMQEWAVGNLHQLQEKRQAGVEEQAAATNKQVADNNRNIQQIQTSAAAAAKSAKWGLWGDIIGIVVSLVAIAVTVALTVPTGGASDAALPAEISGASALITAVSITTSVAMAGVSIAELASGDQFLSKAMAKAGKDMMSKLGPIGGPIVAALIVALTIALTKGAGTALASAGASTGVSMAAMMASVTAISTLLGSSNIVALGVADCFHNPNSEVAQLVSSIVQMAILLAVAIMGGKMMMSGGALFGEGATSSVSAAATDASRGAGDLDDEEMAEMGAPPKDTATAPESSEEPAALPEDANAQATLIDDNLATHEAEQTARTTEKESVKEQTQVEKQIDELISSLSKLINRLGDALDGKVQQLKQAVGDLDDPTNLRSFAARVNQMNTAVGAGSGAARGIAQGMLSLEQSHISETQAGIQDNLAEVDGLISMLKTSIKLLDDNSSSVQTMLNQIANENGDIMKAIKDLMSRLTSMLQKLESA